MVRVCGLCGGIRIRKQVHEWGGLEEKESVRGMPSTLGWTILQHAGSDLGFIVVG